MAAGDRVLRPMYDLWRGLIEQAGGSHAEEVVLASGSVVAATPSSPLDTTLTATIAAGASLSGAVDIGEGYTLVGLITASTWDAAAVSIEASATAGGTYVVAKDAYGVQLGSASVTGANYVTLGGILADLKAVRHLKIRSGTTASPVAQADETIVTLIRAKLA